MIRNLLILKLEKKMKVCKFNLEMIEISKNKIEEFKQFYNREWKLWEDKKTFKIFYLDEKSGLRSVKSVITIDRPIKDVISNSTSLWSLFMMLKTKVNMIKCLIVVM